MNDVPSNKIIAYENHGVTSRDWSLRTCAFSCTSDRAEQAFEQLQQEIGEYVPEHFIFELYPVDQLEAVTAIVFGGRIDSMSGSFRVFMNCEEKAFIEKANTKLGADYKTVEELVLGELSQRLGVPVEHNKSPIFKNRKASSHVIMAVEERHAGDIQL